MLLLFVMTFSFGQLQLVAAEAGNVIAAIVGIFICFVCVCALLGWFDFRLFSSFFPFFSFFRLAIEKPHLAKMERTSQKTMQKMENRKENDVKQLEESQNEEVGTDAQQQGRGFYRKPEMRLKSRQRKKSTMTCTGQLNCVHHSFSSLLFVSVPSACFRWARRQNAGYATAP